MVIKWNKQPLCIGHDQGWSETPCGWQCSLCLQRECTCKNRNHVCFFIVKNNSDIIDIKEKTQDILSFVRGFCLEKLGCYGQKGLKGES